MLIQAITLNTPSLTTQRHFYIDVLGLPLLDESTTAFTVQAGASRITFAADKLHEPYHFALDIPENQFAAARQWLAQRVPLLADGTGQTEFAFTDWNATALYFKDASGNIVELIARHNLPTASTEPFAASSIVRISEIGIVTSDVLQTVGDLVEHVGAPIWRGAGSDTFSAVGSEEGLFIVTRIGRNWLPTSDVPAAIAPITIEAGGVQSYIFPTLPYRVRAVPGATVASATSTVL